MSFAHARRILDARFLLITLLFLVACAPTHTNSAQTKSPEPYPFQNPDLPAEQRIDDLLHRMTIDEKIAALGTDPSVRRLGVVGTRHVEGLHGLAQGGPGGWGRPREVPTTMFPQAIGLAMTWNPDLIRQCAAEEAYEARYIFQNPKYHQGGLIVRAPNADLGRDPRWGRTEECFGEDAFLNATMVVAVVHGLQGDDPRYWQCASLMKHFLANSTEDDRTRVNADFDPRLFHEYYARPFEMGIVQGGSRAFMAAYNLYDGIPCTVHPVLRHFAINLWGNDGIICTDASALQNLVNTERYYPDLAHAAAGAVKAGINQFLDRQAKPLRDALAAKLLTQADIDERLRGVYRVMIKLGMLDPAHLNPYAAIGSPQHDPVEPWQRPEIKALAREVTRQSIVLLKNEGHLLPLNDQKLKSIAIIGPRSFEVLGDWYGGTPPYAVTPIEAVRARIRAEVEARAIERHNLGIDVPFNDPAPVPGRPAPPVRLAINYAPSDDDGGVVYSATHSDVAVVFVGNHPTGAAGWNQRTEPSFGKEAIDRSSLTLEQEDLVRRVRAANPRTVVVLISSFPYAINWTQANVPAILYVTHSSQELGNAVADVLFGDVNPAGRLVQTWPRKMEDLPPMLDYNLRDGRTYMYAKAQPLYPFGFGLSYTTFTYDNFKTDSSDLSPGGVLHASVDITNTGSRAGDEVVQLYAHHIGSKIDRPIRELKAFRRVSLNAGQTKTVSLDLPADQFNYWDVGRGAWSLEADDVELEIGSSSADIRLTQTLQAKGSAPSPQAMVTLINNARP